MPIAGSPPIIITYGPAKHGKTVDMGYSFPGALFIGIPGGLKSIVATLGYEPPLYAEADTIEDVTRVLEARVKSKSLPPQGVVIDDLSILADNEEARLDKIIKNGWMKHKTLRDSFRRMLSTATEAGVPVYGSCHERPPKYDDETKVLTEAGGPKMPTAGLSVALGGLATHLLRITMRTKLTTARSWRVGYTAGGGLQGTWISGDRDGIVWGIEAPQNLRELLRASGAYPAAILARPKGLEWMDDAVNGYVAHMLDQKSKGTPDMLLDSEVRQHITGLHAAGHVTPVVARWLMRDTLDRYDLHTYRSKRESNPLADF